MKLSTQEAELFFRLMWQPQNYVNQKLDILPDIATIEEYSKLPSSKKLAVRNVLFDNIDLIDAFLLDNPDGLANADLDIVRSWKQFIRDDFFIERILKKYAIFIGGENVYGVLALFETFEEMLPFAEFPYLTKAILLPFRGKIIYDGLLEGYSISFGRGIRSNLKEIYLAAKQNGRIIESFDPKIPVERTAKKEQSRTDLGPTIEEILQLAKKLRSSSGSPAIHSPAFSLAKASMEFAKLAVENPEDVDELWRALQKVERAIRKAETTLYRSEYEFE